MTKRILLLISLLILPELVYSHEIVGYGFLSGLRHPVLGVDHLLAMVSVGIISAQMGGRAIWTIPAAFVSAMIFGGILGIFKVPLPMVEYGIIISVIVLGVAIAFERKMPVIASMIFVGFFAVFHGHAHGTEMPDLATPLFYALGFVLGTTGIHLLGVLTGYLATRKDKAALFLRYTGAVIAVIGIKILMDKF